MRPVPAIPMPLSLADSVRAFRTAAPARDNLQTSCAKRFGACACYAVSSGRAALWLALSALRDTAPDRRRVILPAYICPTIGRAVQAAGLQGICADVSISTFTIDPASVHQLIDNNTLAVVAPHMFGVPCDVSILRTLCDYYGVALIEDLAQCFGGAINGKSIGTCCDIGFTSLGRAKNLRGYRGGLLWVQNPSFQQAIDAHWANLPEPRHEPAALLTQAAISMLSGPHAWNLLRRLPFLRVGEEDQNFDASPSRLTGWMAALAHISLQRVDHFNVARAEFAYAIRAALQDTDNLHLQELPPDIQCTFPRIAIRVCPEKRDRIVCSLQARGIDARAFYTHITYDYDWWQHADDQPECPVASDLLSTNLILPVHYAMTTADAGEMASIVEGVVADAGPCNN